MKIGFIGLGIMGKPMARNLLKGGHSLVIYDIVPAMLDAMAGSGMERGESCADVALRSELVITMLPDGHSGVIYEIVPAMLHAMAGSGMERGESCADVALRSELV